jgi:hypothetical protein
MCEVLLRICYGLMMGQRVVIVGTGVVRVVDIAVVVDCWRRGLRV